MNKEQQQSLQERANAGSPLAACRLGNAYRNTGVEKDERRLI